MSDRGDSSRDVLLRVRVENLSTAGFKQVSEAINLITSSLDTQIAAANRAEIKERELAASLTKLDQAARNLAGLDALIARYKNFDATLASSEARVEAARKKLADYRQSLEASGDTTDKAGKALARLVTAYDQADKALTEQKQKYADLSGSLQKAGVDLNNLTQFERESIAVQNLVGQGRSKVAAAILDLTQNQRLARDAAIAERAEQEKLTASLRAQADARAKMAGEGQRQYQDALRRNTDTAAVQKREYDAAVAATKARVDAERERVATERAFIDSAMARSQKFKTENLARIKAERDAETAAARAKIDAERAKNDAIVASQKAFNDRMAAEAKRSAEIARFENQQGRGGPLPALTPMVAGRAAARPGARGEAQQATLLGLRPYELQNLSYQVNDIITGIASGQDATQILAQQGGQVLQLFSRNLFELVRFLPAIALGIGVVTLAVGALTTAFRNVNAIREFQGLLTLSADGARYQAAQLLATTRQIQNFGVSFTDAVKGVRDAIAAGIRSERLVEFGKTAQDIADVTGKTFPEAMKMLIAGTTGGIDAVRKLNEETKFLTLEQYKEIQALFDQGKGLEANTKAFALFSAAASKGAKEAVSPLTVATRELSVAWRDLLEELSKAVPVDFIIGEIKGIAKAVKDTVDEIKAIVETIKEIRDYVAARIPPILGGAPRPPRQRSTLDADNNLIVYPTDTPATGTATATVNPQGAQRLSIQPNVVLDSEDLRQLRDILAAATRSLPEGTRAEVVSGRASRASGTKEHPEGRALDVKLIDKDGRVIPGFMGVDSTGQYKAFATVALAEARRLQPGRVAEFESGTQYGKQDSGHFGFRVGGAQGSRGPLPGGPALALTDEQREAQKIADEAQVQADRNHLDAQNTVNRAVQEERIRREEINRLKNEGKSDDQAKASAEIKVNDYLRTERRREREESAHDRAQRITDGRNAAAIEAAGIAARQKLEKAGEVDIAQLRKAELEGRDEARRTFAAATEMRNAERELVKQLAGLDREDALKNLSNIDARVKAVSDRFVSARENAAKFFEKFTIPGKPAPTIQGLNAEQFGDRLTGLEGRAKQEEEAKARMEQLNALQADRNALVSTYNILVEKGVMSIADKEAKVLELFGRTGPAISAAAAEMRKFLSTADAIDPTKLDLFNAKLQEIEANAKHVSPMWKAISGAIEESFTSGLSSAFNTVGEALGGLIAKTKSWKDVWDSVKSAALSFFSQLLRSIAEAIIKLEAAKIASSIIGDSSGGGGSFFGKALGFIGSLFGGGGEAAIAGTGGLWHQGGVVGHTAVPQRATQASWFVNAPRYHSGRGAVGLAPDEQAAILQRGEEVLSRSSPRNIMNGGGSSPDINIRSVLLLDRELIPSAMAGTHGEQTVMAHIRQNIGTIRQMVKP